MSVATSVIKGIDDILQGVNGYLGLSVHDYCRLETVYPDDDKILVGDDGSMCSMIRIRGSLVSRGEEDYRSFSREQARALHTKFSQAGHVMQVMFDYNPYTAKERIEEYLTPAKNTAKNMGMDLDSIYDDWGEAISQYCAEEKIFFILWTTPDVLSSRDKGAANRKMRRTAAKTSPPLSKHNQNVGMFMDELRHQHESFMHIVIDEFHDLGIVAESMESYEALREIRKAIDYDFTAKDWKPVLPGDKLIIRYPDYDTKSKDALSLTYPSLQHQLFPREPLTIKKAVEIGNRLHQSILLSVPAQNPSSFMNLFTRLRDKEIPWRASFFIDANGLKHVSFRYILAQILQYNNSHNQKFVKAVDALEKQHNECKVRFRATFSTWVYNNDDESALSKLSQNINKLAAAVQSWGSCDVSEMIGDAMLGVSCTLPGTMLSTPAPACAAPLTDVMFMMPMSRPASPWDEGHFLLRTPDGQIIPFHPFSSRQASWGDIGVAPMGQGKSVFLNTYNYAYLFQPGLKELPYLSIVDIGPSSKGLISLLQSILPENKKHLVIYKAMKMSKDCACNPFDTPLGCREPLPSQKAYLINFLSLLATPLDKQNPQDGISGLASTVIDRTYKEFSDEVNPKEYFASDNEIVRKAVEENHIKVGRHTTWWYIVDELFKLGLYREAEIAQRYAVPTLDEVASLVNHRLIADTYSFESESGEKITAYFNRTLIEAIENFPIFKFPTQFDVGAARVVSLDLDEVAPRGGGAADRQTAVMYMLARHMIASKFFQVPSDVALVPNLYKAYHAKVIQNLIRSPKRLAYDETHRVSKNGSISRQILGDLETASRESRKKNLSIGLYSQHIDDYPDIFIELATQIFIFGAGDEKSIETLCSRFGFNNVIADRLRLMSKPTKRGANCIAYLKTDVGDLKQELTSTLGPKALWAFSSTNEDNTVRNALYERVGVKKTLDILGKMFPGGIKPEVERRRLKVASDPDLRNIDVLEQLINELHEKVLMSYEA